MAAGDIKILKSHYGVETFDVSDRTTSSVTATVKPGEPVKRILNTSTHSAQPLADGDAEHGTDIFIGIAKSESTETASVAGKVDVEIVGPGTVIQARPTTATNVNTAAKFILLQNDYVCFDVTAVSGTNGTFTIDEDEGDDPNVHTGIMLSNSPIGDGLINMLICNATMFGSTV